MVINVPAILIAVGRARETFILLTKIKSTALYFNVLRSVVFELKITMTDTLDPGLLLLFSRTLCI